MTKKITIGEDVFVEMLDLVRDFNKTNNRGEQNSIVYRLGDLTETMADTFCDISTEIQAIGRDEFVAKRKLTHKMSWGISK